MGSARIIIEALAAAILAETAAPENADGTGGTSFPVEVLFGDEERNKLQGTTGRVELTLNEACQVEPPKKMQPLLQTLCTVTVVIEAHLWAPIGPVGERNSLGRWDAIEALWKAVLRAWYGTIVNAHASGPARPLAEGVELNRDEKKLRNGQALVMMFPLSIPVCRGRTLTTFPQGTLGTVTIVANPPTT